MESELERVIEQKVKTLVDDAMQKFLGVTISELEKDITSKLRKWSPLLEFDIDTNILFKKAKRLFKRYYFTRLLKNVLGNVSDMAKISGVQRESIHRLMKPLKIDPDTIREEVVSKEYAKESAVQNIIERSLGQYKTVLHPQKLEVMYKNAPGLSKNIARELPEKPLTYKEAEHEFEIAYVKKALSENSNNISQTARKIGLRFETLHRKMKALGLIS